MLSRDQFLAPKAPRTEEVHVDALGGSIFVRVMTGAERDSWEALHQKDTYRDFRARVVAATMCDESGALLFTAADYPALGKLPTEHLDPVVDAAMKLNRMRSGDVEAAAKNSGAAPSGSSPSGSPAT